MQHQATAHLSSSASSPVGDLRLIDFLTAIRKYRRSTTILMLIVFAVLSVIVITDRPVYRASVTIAPATPLIDPERVSLTDGLLIGLGLDETKEFGVFQAQTSSVEAFAMLSSRAIGRRFIESEHLLPILFADLWNSVSQTWSDTDPELQPSLDDALQLFEREIRYISRSVSTGFVRINIEWSDPELAAAWANRLVEITDEVIRERDIGEAQDAIDFLRERARIVPLESVRRLIYSLIESYAKTIMVARVKDSYAFTIIDPAIPPREDQPINMPASFKLSLAMLCAIGCGLLYLYILLLTNANRTKADVG